MAGGYVICEYETVRKSFPEFDAVMKTLRSDLIAKSTKDWNKSFGGMTPSAAQFGESTIIPALFNDISNTRLTTWEQWLTNTGHQTIMTGAATGGTIYEDYKIGLVGLVFLSKAIRISEIKMQISDRKIPRINVEEAMAYNKPAIVLEEGYILDEETGFDLYAYVTTEGPQRIKLLGVEMNRVPNKLQVTNAGAALT